MANLLTAEQASFEGGTVTGWTSNGFDTLSTTTLVSSHGTRSMLIVPPGFFQVLVTTETVKSAVTAGQVYSFIVDARRASSTSGLYVYAKWYNAGGSEISTDIGSSVTINSTGWTQVTMVNKTAPVGATQAALFVEGDNSSNIDHYLDRAGIMEGNTTTWTLPGAGPANPKVTIELWENGSLKSTLATDIEITSEGVLSYNWDASILTAISGANVELRISSTGDVDIGAIEWNLIETSSPPALVERWGFLVM